MSANLEENKGLVRRISRAIECGDLRVLDDRRSGLQRSLGRAGFRAGHSQALFTGFGWRFRTWTTLHQPAPPH
jgi:hypothetical protein